MVHREHIVPVVPMARILAGLPVEQRRNPGVAAAAIEAAGYLADDVAAGLAEAMRRAEDLALAAASDRPWAVLLGDLRDALSLAVFLAALAAWLVPA